MNQSAERHLAKARDYLARGDGWYEKAAVEMRAAKDDGATWPEIADALERGTTWVRTIVRWAESPANGGRASVTPFAREPGVTSEDRAAAKKTLREAPLEQVEQIISELPRERQRAVGAAAGHAYLGARQQYDEEESRMTPAQRKEREAITAEVGRQARSMAAGFTSLGIVGHIEQATEELQELNSDASLTPEMIEQIERALKPLLVELEVAKGLAGLEAS